MPRPHEPTLRAACPETSFTIEAAGDRKRFTMRAYSGGPLTLKDYDAPVVVDLAGVTISAQNLPTPHNHDLDNVIGETDAVTITANGIEATGFLDTGTDDGELVAAAGKGGLAWEASIGAPVHAMEFFDKGETVEVNARKFHGPVYVARKTTLKEISFVRRGADRNQTHVAIAAQLKGIKAMDEFENWLKELGFDAATLSDEQKSALQSAYDAQLVEAEVDEEEEDMEGEGKKKKAAPPVAAIKAMFRDMKTVWDIEAACKDHPEIKAAALSDTGKIKAGWNLPRVRSEIELKTLRASRETGSYIAAGTPNGANRFDVIQAALFQAGKLPGHEKMFPDQTLQAAHTAYKGRLGLQQMILEAAFANGYRGGINAIRADHAGVLRAAFSTVSLPGILSNVANKFLLDGFMHVEQAWRSISATRNVSDFKTVTSYRMLGDDIFEKMAPTGEFKHATVDEESFTNSADTYGKMFSISRKDQINDDLGALTDKPRRIGRGAGTKLNDVFWTAFCDNSSFFADPSAHYYKGADSVLASAGLAKVLAKFRNKVDDSNRPLAIEPRILLVPPTLEVTALELLKSSNYNTGGAATSEKIPNSNIWAGRFNPVVSTYLENASYGNSTVVWYLLADPMDIATIEACFLNGQETPTVESAEADFNVLGIQMRGYFDFGVTKQDARGAVKSKGAA
jgi:hypothetical protein